MIRECIETGRTVDQAIENACLKLGLSGNEVKFEIIDMPKKSLFGLKTTNAKVRVYVEEDEAPAEREEKPALPPSAELPRRHRDKNEQAENTKKEKPPVSSAQPENVQTDSDEFKKAKISCAVEYLSGILNEFGLENVEIKQSYSGHGILLSLTGDSGLGAIIGRRGETLDALQYITGLVANRSGGDYLRVTIDSGNYREKREKTLQALAKRIAYTVVKTGRSTTLEPMSPYERRVIHSAISNIPNVISTSVGDEPGRRVVVSPKNRSGGNQYTNRAPKSGKN